VEALPRAAEIGKLRKARRRKANPRKIHGTNTITGHSGLNPACANIFVPLLPPLFASYRAMQQSTSSAKWMLHLSGGNDRRPTEGCSQCTLEIDPAGIRSRNTHGSRHSAAAPPRRTASHLPRMPAAKTRF